MPREIKGKTEIVERVLQLMNDGQSISAAARAVGQNRAVIGRWLKEIGHGGEANISDVVYSFMEKKSIVIAVAESVARGMSRKDAIEAEGITYARFAKWLTCEPSLRVEFHVLSGKMAMALQSRKNFDAILEHIRDGKAVQRDGARWKVQLVDGALMRYELDGANTWRCKGFSTFSGPDVLAKDWTVLGDV